MESRARDPLVVILLLVFTVSAAASALPVLASSLIGGVQTVLAIRWLRRYGQGGEGF